LAGSRSHLLPKFRGVPDAPAVPAYDDDQQAWRSYFFKVRARFFTLAQRLLPVVGGRSQWDLDDLHFYLLLLLILDGSHLHSTDYTGIYNGLVDDELSAALIEAITSFDATSDPLASSDVRTHFQRYLSFEEENLDFKRPAQFPLELPQHMIDLTDEEGDPPPPRRPPRLPASKDINRRYRQQETLLRPVRSFLQSLKDRVLTDEEDAWVRRLPSAYVGHPFHSRFELLARKIRHGTTGDDPFTEVHTTAAADDDDSEVDVELPPARVATAAAAVPSAQVASPELVHQMIQRLGVDSIGTDSILDHIRKLAVPNVYVHPQPLYHTTSRAARHASTPPTMRRFFGRLACFLKIVPRERTTGPHVQLALQVLQLNSTFGHTHSAQLAADTHAAVIALVLWPVGKKEWVRACLVWDANVLAHPRHKTKSSLDAHVLKALRLARAAPKVPSFESFWVCKGRMRNHANLCLGLSLQEMLRLAVHGLKLEWKAGELVGVEGFVRVEDDDIDGILFQTSTTMEKDSKPQLSERARARRRIAAVIALARRTYPAAAAAAAARRERAAGPSSATNRVRTAQAANTDAHVAAMEEDPSAISSDPIEPPTSDPPSDSSSAMQVSSSQPSQQTKGNGGARAGATKEHGGDPPKDTATAVDYMAPNLIGYTLVSIGLDQSGNQPTLVLGPLQRTAVRAQVNRLFDLGFKGLQRESIQHAIAISVDPDLIDPSSVTKSASGPFQRVRFTDGASKQTMLLQAGQHRRDALRLLFADELKEHKTLSALVMGTAKSKMRLDVLSAHLDEKAFWLASLYNRKLESQPDEYFPFLLQVGSNNNVGPLSDTDSDYYNNLVRAVGNVGTEAGLQKIREWAATQKDTTVRKLIHRYPDVITLFAELHKIEAFRAMSVPPTDLLELKRVAWGFYEPCVRGMLLILRWLASPMAIPTSAKDDPTSPDYEVTMRNRLSRMLLRKADLPYSQRILDIIVNVAANDFRLLLEDKMAFFGAGVVREDTSAWVRAWRAYRDALVTRSNGWAMEHQLIVQSTTGLPAPEFTEEEKLCWKRLQAKLELVLDHPGVTGGFPLLPSVGATAWPLLCPDFLIALGREFTSLSPLLRLVSHWFVPGVTDTAKLRIGTYSVHTDAIPSETEQILTSLQYFQHRTTPGMSWSTSTPSQIGAVLPNVGDDASNSDHLNTFYFRMIKVLLRVRGSLLADSLPAVAAAVWCKVEDAPIDEEHEWSAELEEWTREEDAPYLAAMGQWAKESLRNAPPHTTRGHTQLRLLQECPKEVADVLPSSLVTFLESTMINWTAATSGVRNNDQARKRFLTTAEYELRVTAGAHMVLLDEDAGLWQLRQRLRRLVRLVPGLGDFEWWYESNKSYEKADNQLRCQGDDFITLAGKRMELATRQTAVVEVLNRMVHQLSKAEMLGIPLPKKTEKHKERQRYGLDPAVRNQLWEFSHCVIELSKDVQSAHVGMTSALLATDFARADHESTDDWKRFRGLRLPVFASVEDVHGFFQDAQFEYPVRSGAGRSVFTPSQGPPTAPASLNRSNEQEEDGQDDDEDEGQVIVPSTSQQVQPPRKRGGTGSVGTTSDEQTTPTPAPKKRARHDVAAARADAAVDPAPAAVDPAPAAVDPATTGTVAGPEGGNNNE
ncbi:hypothetical protein B0H12DRAFT_1082205, partial [Mycena haematopus]